MNVPNEDLNALRSLAGRIQRTIQDAMSEARPYALLEEASRQAAQLVTRLEAAGAERPVGVRPAPSIPLGMLDTPANRCYARALREAWEAGLAVDRERYGPNIGTDGCAQVIEMVLADVEMEVNGPAGMVRE